MAYCSLRKFTIKTPKYYVGKNGEKYLYDRFANVSENKHGKIALPLDNYPYSIEYSEKLKWKCCKICDCKE
jgi:hypothetical protein